jgi:alpha-methylacyl-CoA racemase
LNPDPLARRKRSLVVDISHPRGRALLHRLAAQADILIDPFRPGVLESHQLGPSDLLPLNPGLIYARLSGFRRDVRESRYARMAGHDINYLAVSGVLSMLGRKDGPPTPPMNLLADFAGGGAMLVLGILLALLQREKAGKGQVVEANMVDGSSYLATFARSMRHTPAGSSPRGENLLDSGAPFYDTYRTKDGGWMAVGALEARFFALLVKGLGLEGQGWEERQGDRASWEEMRTTFATVFAGRTRREWEAVFDGTDACATPVLGYDELQNDADREGDCRPPVRLRDTPLLSMPRDVKQVETSQGPGVNRNEYHPTLLAPGERGQEVLREWLGWTEGIQYEASTDGVLLKEKPKL